MMVVNYELERICKEIVLIYPGGTGQNHANISRHNRSQGSNPELPGYEECVLSTARNLEVQQSQHQKPPLNAIPT